MADQPPYAEYPRPNQPGFLPYGRGPGIYFESIGESWEVVRKDLGHWIAASFVAIVAMYASMLPFLPWYFGALNALQRRPTEGTIAQGLLSYFLMVIVSFVVQSLLTAGMIGMGVRKLRGEYINVGMIFEPFRRFGTMLGVCLLNGVIVAASYVACFLPVLYFYPVLILMPTVAFLRGTGPVEALSLTFDACKRHGLGMLALLFVLWIMVSVGTIFCIVPGLIAYAMLTVALAIHYRAFFESTPPGYP